jgi:hypothetical protein
MAGGRFGTIDAETAAKILAAAGPAKRAAAEVATVDAPHRKYRNTIIEFEGVRYESKKELRRYLDLREEQRAGTITELRRQVDFPIMVNGVEVCVYRADAVYVRDGRQVIEDVKSAATRKLPLYRLKKKLMKAALGIEVREV